MKRITVDLDDDMAEDLRKAAFDRRESMADIVRKALEKELAPKEGQ